MKGCFCAAATLIACGLLVGQGLAAEQTKEKEQMSKNGLTQDLMRVSNEGYDALRSIHLARLAIFNGDAKITEQFLDRAKKDLDAASKDAQTWAANTSDKENEKAENDQAKSDQTKRDQAKNDQAKIDKTQSDKSQTDKSQHDDDVMIPIDGQIAVADTFVSSGDKNKHIEKANEHLKTGKSKDALEELRLGEVDVVFTRVLLPLEKTKKRVADADKLVKDHKYYEANQALKAAEDGVVVDAIDLIGTPRSKAPKTASTVPAPKS